MGGKLFGLGRIERAEYLVIEKKVIEYLDKKLPLAYRIPRYYAAKADFGDMDVIVSAEQVGKDWHWLKQEIAKDLGLENQQQKSVSNLFSTAYQNFQVDFFNVPAIHLESTYNYLSFNDLGNLIGRICKKFNLKYGEQGLLYVYRREDGNYHKDLPITTDFRRICAFLGLKYEVWESGFDKLEDIFQWAIESPYFSVVPYLEAKSIEKRAKNRPTIARFLDYLESHNITKTCHFEGDKQSYLPHILSFFAESDLAYQIAKEQAQEARASALQTKFNGQYLMTLLPALNGRALGAFIVDFKALFSNTEAFEAYILDTPQEIIAQRIVDFYSKLSK